MKTVVLSMAIAFGISVGFGGMLLAAEATTQPTTQQADGKWVCPMKCEGSTSDKPGNCPVCGMKLQKEKAADKHGAAEAKPDKAHHNEKHGH